MSSTSSADLSEPVVVVYGCLLLSEVCRVTMGSAGAKLMPPDGAALVSVDRAMLFRTQ